MWPFGPWTRPDCITFSQDVNNWCRQWWSRTLAACHQLTRPHKLVGQTVAYLDETRNVASVAPEKAQTRKASNTMGEGIIPHILHDPRSRKTVANNIRSTAAVAPATGDRPHQVWSIKVIILIQAPCEVDWGCMGLWSLAPFSLSTSTEVKRLGPIHGALAEHTPKPLRKEQLGVHHDKLVPIAGNPKSTCAIW